METSRISITDDTVTSEELLTDTNDLHIEFINIYDEKEGDLALAMNCSNG